jgi:hypothetical protein
LAGEAATDDFDFFDAVSGKSSGSKLFDVIIYRNLRPMPFQNLLAIGLNLAKRYSLKARCFKPQAEPADAGKQIKHAH